MIVFALSIHLFARMTLAQVRNFGKRKVNAFSFSEKSAKLGVSAFAEGLGQFSSLAGMLTQTIARCFTREKG